MSNIIKSNVSIYYTSFSARMQYLPLAFVCKIVYNGPTTQQRQKDSIMTHTKKIALSGVFTGLSLALMWTGSFVPGMDYVMPMVASMFTFVLVIELGPAWPAGVYLATSILVALLLPNKVLALIYIMFFGFYPVLRHLLQHKLPKWLAWALKLLVFNATMISAYYLAVFVFALDISDFGLFGQYAVLFMLVAGNFAFVLYDAAILSSFEVIYIKRWRKKLRRLMA